MSRADLVRRPSPPAPLAWTIAAAIGRALEYMLRALRGRRARASAADGDGARGATVDVTSDLRSSSSQELIGDARLVEATPELAAEQYAELVTQLQRRPDATVLDLRAFKFVQVGLLQQLCDGWPADPPSRAKLAVVLAYDAWTLLPRRTDEIIDALADIGVGARFFYAQQLVEGHVRTWLERDATRHALSTVLAWLRTEWEPRSEPSWISVLRSTSRLIQEVGQVEAVPGLLIELAEIASSFPSPGGRDEALRYLHATLHWIGDSQHPDRCRALRAIAGLWTARGNNAAAHRILLQALDAATVLGDRSQAGAVLLDLGVRATRLRDSERAASYLRHGLATTTKVEPAELRAALHQALARALHEHPQRSRHSSEAERHATAALSLRRDPRSELAREDQELLEQIQSERAAARTRSRARTIAAARSTR